MPFTVAPETGFKSASKTHTLAMACVPPGTDSVLISISATNAVRPGSWAASIVTVSVAVAPSLSVTRNVAVYLPAAV